MASVFFSRQLAWIRSRAMLNDSTLP